MLPGSGNYMVDMHEKMEAIREASKRECPDCYKGERDLSWAEFKEWLENKFAGNEGIFKDALALYRMWKEEGTVICDKCEGEGYIYDTF